MNFIGSKYKHGRDVKDIAQLVRADIKAVAETGGLPKGIKVSIRIHRYAGGRSLNAHIRHLGTERVINPAWVKWHDANPRGYQGDTPSRYTATASNTIKTIEAIIAAYNFNDSNHQTDYHCVNFHSTTEFDYEYREADETLTRREGLYFDESEEALEEAIEKGSVVTCTGNDDCPACQMFKVTAPRLKPIQSFPVFNQRHPYVC